MEVDTSWPIGVQGRGMSDECLLSLPSPEPTLTNTSTQGQSSYRKNRNAGIEAAGTSRPYPALCAVLQQVVPALLRHFRRSRFLRRMAVLSAVTTLRL